MRLPIIFTSALAIVTRRGEPKDTGSLSNDHLPLDRLPECWQKCFQSTNHAYPPDVNKVGIRDFCEDKLWHLRMWDMNWLSACSTSDCNDEDINLGQTWFEDVCNAH
ncbi:hypothetical protein QIS74_03922 [Colletotrichum tabaci]|uniref:Uncharacterized protein n=2 Tax=Colletotrichum destructivum species complex TaxID=2707350 RepID=A0AAV9TLR3_9PEZI|nr:hypothetical protein CDEST_10924 [Colletotrichum destructivum]